MKCSSELESGQTDSVRTDHRRWSQWRYSLQCGFQACINEFATTVCIAQFADATQHILPHSSLLNKIPWIVRNEASQWDTESSLCSRLVCTFSCSIISDSYCESHCTENTSLIRLLLNWQLCIYSFVVFFFWHRHYLDFIFQAFEIPFPFSERISFTGLLAYFCWRRTTLKKFPKPFGTHNSTTWRKSNGLHCATIHTFSAQQCKDLNKINACRIQFTVPTTQSCSKCDCFHSNHPRIWYAVERHKIHSVHFIPHKLIHGTSFVANNNNNYKIDAKTFILNNRYNFRKI